MWWSGFSKLRVEPPKHSLRGTAYLRRIPRFRVWTLTHLVYPSAGGLHASVDSDGEEDASVLNGVDLGPQVDMWWRKNRSFCEAIPTLHLRPDARLREEVLRTVSCLVPSHLVYPSAGGLHSSRWIEVDVYLDRVGDTWGVVAWEFFIRPTVTCGALPESP